MQSIVPGVQLARQFAWQSVVHEASILASHWLLHAAWKWTGSHAVSQPPFTLISHFALDEKSNFPQGLSSARALPAKARRDRDTGTIEMRIVVVFMPSRTARHVPS